MSPYKYYSITSSIYYTSTESNNKRGVILYTHIPRSINNNDLKFVLSNHIIMSNNKSFAQPQSEILQYT